MDIALEKMADLLNNVENEHQDFSIEERQLAAKASADTWEAILNNTIAPLDFKK